MANFPTIRGIGSTEEAEKCYLSGYNGTGAVVAQGSPVCWDVGTNDGKTFEDPVTANFDLAVGIAETTVGTAAYTDRIVAYGPVEARTYGVATTFVPGANLSLVTGKTYLAYNSQTTVLSQRRIFTAMQTNATVDTNLTTIHVHAL